MVVQVYKDKKKFSLEGEHKELNDSHVNEKLLWQVLGEQSHIT
jgi:hypothetical protein